MAIAPVIPEFKLRSTREIALAHDVLAVSAEHFRDELGSTGAVEEMRKIVQALEWVLGVPGGDTFGEVVDRFRACLLSRGVELIRKDEVN